MGERYESFSYSNDNLVFNASTLVTKSITLLTGQSVVRGEVLGKVTLVVPTTGTAGGGNTGAETCTGVTGGAETKLGTYTLTCTTAGASAIFAVKDPEGLALPSASLGVAYTNANINFTINDAGTDPAVGDTFTIVITAGTGKYVKAVSTNVNGSNKVEHMVIASEAIDATSADKVGIAYVSGVFNEGEITIDSSYTLANIKDELEQRGIYFKTAVTN